MYFCVFFLLELRASEGAGGVFSVLCMVNRRLESLIFCALAVRSIRVFHTSYNSIHERNTHDFSKYKHLHYATFLFPTALDYRWRSRCFKLYTLASFCLCFSCVQMLSTKETEILFSLNLLSSVHAKKTTSLHPGISS